MKLTNELYLQYEKQIQNNTLHYTLKFNIEYEELLGDAQLIFCKAVLSFIPEKNVPFKVYLHIQLQNLYKIAKRYKTQAINFQDFSEVIEQLYYYTSPYKFELINSIETELSLISQKIVKALLNGEFYMPEKYGCKSITNKNIQEKFNVSYTHAKKLLAEISWWWKNYEKIYIFN